MDKNRVNYISFMNVVAAVAVVIMHADSNFWHFSKSVMWNVSNVIDSVFYFAVPIFFMLTGATLMDYQKRYSTKEYFKKRFFKTVIPFLFWSVFAMFWSSRKTFEAIIAGDGNQKLNWTFFSVTDGIINTRFLYIYWFFIPLFCIYLAIPFFAAIPEKRRIKVYTYAIVVSAALNYTLPFVLDMLSEYTDFKLTTQLDFFVAFRYLIYVLLGYVLHKCELKLKHRLLLYAAALAGLSILIITTYARSYRTGVLDGRFRGYYNLGCLLYSTGVFVFLKQIASKIKSEKANRFFAYFQGYTFPIYLIHWYFLTAFEENIHYINMEISSPLYIVGATVLALVLSVLTTMLLRKIPLLRKAVP